MGCSECREAAISGCDDEVGLQDSGRSLVRQIAKVIRGLQSSGSQGFSVRIWDDTRATACS